MFTEDDLKQIEKMPLPQLEALIGDMIGAAKRELFKFIAANTGTIPPDDYMLTHKHEFGVQWASGKDLSMASLWTWKGVPVVKQRGTVTFDGVNLTANVRTEACEVV